MRDSIRRTVGLRRTVGVRRTVAVALCAAVCFGVGRASANEEPLRLATLGAKLGYKSQYDVVTGRLTLTKEGTALSLVNGMDRMLVNGAIVPLRGRFAVANGIVQIPPDVWSHVGRPTPEREEPGPTPSVKQRPAKGNFKVVIDPGHGGDHAENVSRTGVYEKDVNLDVSSKLRTLLRENGIEVVMTRDRDIHLDPDVREDLDRRVEFSNREMPDLFISIHSNRADNTDAKGYEIFVAREESAAIREAKLRAMTLREIRERSGRSDVREGREAKAQAERILDLHDQRSKIAAEEIHGAFRGSLSTEDRGIKEAGFYVIKWNRAPAVLVELEFLSNREGARDLGNATHRQKLAQLLSEAVIRIRDRFQKRAHK